MSGSEVGSPPVFAVSDFVAVFNQTLELAYPEAIIIGELANFRVSKNRWVYFDLKDESATLKFFGTIYKLPGPLEDGLMLQVEATPRLHPQFGFSLNVQSIKPVGEGSLRRAAALLEAKLKTEGLFDESRKRSLPYPPVKIGLITSSEAAAYTDFIKIANQRWTGLQINLIDVQVQGESSPRQIVDAIEYFNQLSIMPEVLVIIRGGGNAEDLAAFNTEVVTRAVAASRIPTLVAIGHEIDVSLAELAADKRASTPSNAAELLVPDKVQVSLNLRTASQTLGQSLEQVVQVGQSNIKQQVLRLNHIIVQLINQNKLFLSTKNELLQAVNPKYILQRGFAIIREEKNGTVIKSIKSLSAKQAISIQLKDGQAFADVTGVHKNLGIE